MGQQHSNLLADHLLGTVENEEYAKNTALQQQNLKKLFVELDKDKNGCIDGNEVKNLFTCVMEAYEMAAVNLISVEKNEITKAEVQKLCKSVDENADQKLQFDEFVRLIDILSRVLKEGKSMKNIQALAMILKSK
mmetsp:Transcript_28460/g.43804  ORF Transcript_28460/g.43804 Transcript_28460/m.43804 type:complete len:135 (+) Transcript_28460:125-529(+)|eukprot:CAMPEP_0117034118 /NCGR_PEP_ID=MMETSP0472-20121206/24322_1 /TAXON_ID=693140 ORGANISM="Tiarina fusus, Strain LIS" /NCGR_SAMPLE_ID=MMETSP0472 /ASSEMBLY_ACC=CAM_ASM_000603 /LENGTH=134 /DNA_ID=CAMNT_0004743215 /DNA_START=125 /DNA_END=529 /DNA_ORIENTATION=-